MIGTNPQTPSGRPRLPSLGQTNGGKLGRFVEEGSSQEASLAGGRPGEAEEGFVGGGPHVGVAVVEQTAQRLADVVVLRADAAERLGGTLADEGVGARQGGTGGGECRAALVADLPQRLNRGQAQLRVTGSDGPGEGGDRGARGGSVPAEGGRGGQAHVEVGVIQQPCQRRDGGLRPR